MPSFSVLAELLESGGSRLNSYKRELSLDASRIKAIRNTLPIYGNIGREIRSALKNSSNNICILASDINKLGNGLNTVGKCYVAVELKSYKWDWGDTFRASALVACMFNCTTFPFAVWQFCNVANQKPGYDDLLNAASEFGLIGSFAAIAGKGAKVLKGESLTMQDWAYIGNKGLSGLKSTYKVFNDIADKPLDKRQLFGYSTENVTASWGKFKETIKEFSFKNAKSIGQKGKTAAKWAGAIGVAAFGLASKYYENYVDIDPNDINNSNERKIAETVTETVVDFAVDKAINIGLTAAAAAIIGATPVGWAAVGIGVATVGVKWAADKLCEKITGKDLTEMISDAAIDATEYICAKVGDSAKKLMGAVSGRWNEITSSPLGASGCVAGS